jgi:hypothetical protein
VTEDSKPAAPEFTDREPLPSGLIPAERIALTVARAQLERGDNPPVNITTVLVMTIDRLLAGRAEALPEGTATEAEGAVLGYSLAICYPDGAIRMDPLGSVFTDPAQAMEQRDAAAGHSAARGWDERWVAVRLTEVKEDGDA